MKSVMNIIVADIFAIGCLAMPGWIITDVAGMFRYTKSV